MPPHAADEFRDAPPSRAARRSALRAAATCAALWLVPLALLVLVLGPSNLFAQQAVLFSTTAVITFGGAYAALGYIAQRAVIDFRWLTSQDMAVGLGLAETTPGPLVLVIQFVGFVSAYNNPGSLPPLLAGCIGAAIALWMIFVPCFLFIFLGAPYVERLRHSRPLHHALTAVGAVVVGVVASLALLFATTTAFSAWPDVTSVRPVPIAIAIVAAVLVFVRRLGTLKVLATCAVLGVVATTLLGA